MITFPCKIDTANDVPYRSLLSFEYSLVILLDVNQQNGIYMYRETQCRVCHFFSYHHTKIYIYIYIYL